MSPSAIPKELVAYLSAPSTTSQYAVDALEEWILYRRSKGDTLFDVSVGLVDLEGKTPPHFASAFDAARYVTSLPDISDLTPPSGVFPMHRSQSPATIVAHLLGQPSPSLEHSREVILEYVLAKETKARDKKPGKGGKGSLSREALEEISDRLTEIEQGLMNRDGRRLDLGELDEPRQLGMTLVLSLRMSLSYFTLQDLSKQLLKVPLGVAERILVQHIRRRVPGEGRWGVGKELEYLESLTIQQRPALRPAFRSAKARTLLPVHPTFPIALPAPSKSGCVKLIQSFASDTGVSPSTYFSRRGFAGSSTDSNSPKSPISPLPLSPTSLPADPNRLAEYTQEVVTEFLTREKREYMLKTKWARSGRDQLSKDLGDIELSLCLVSKQQPSPLAQALVPVFLELRRTFVLLNSPLPTKLIDAFADLLPAPPDPDDIPFREPSLQTATSSLYVNPRLQDSAAFEILQELVTYEKEILQERGMDDVSSALVQVVEYVEKRFPDASYKTAFSQAKELAANNGVSQIPVTPAPPAPIVKQPSMHRRVKSHFESRPAQSVISEELGPPPTRARQHSRSTSMPHRSNTMESLSDSDESIGIELTATHQTVDRASVAPPPRIEPPPTLPPLSFTSPIETNLVAESGSSSAGGWWDIVSAVQPHPPSAPWYDNIRSSTRKRTTSGGLSSLPVPPGAEPAAIHQVEPVAAQLQGLDRSNTTGYTSRRGSAPGTPARLPQGILPTEAPSPSRRPESGSSSPHIDFSKRQSDATLNEELGNLMISPGRPARPAFSPPSSSRPGMLSPTRNHMTPGGSPRYPVDTNTPQTGSPGRALPPQPLYRGQTDSSEIILNDTDSEDSDGEVDRRDIRPPQPIFSPPQHRTMAHTAPRPSLDTSFAHAQPHPEQHRSSESATLPNAKPARRGWKSVSAAIGIIKDKDKTKEKEKEIEKVVRTGNKAWPENDPGRWNKNMVANIMGPPAERR